MILLTFLLASFLQESVQIPGVPKHLAVVDLDGDQKGDLVQVHEGLIVLLRAKEEEVLGSLWRVPFSIQQVQAWKKFYQGWQFKLMDLEENDLDENQKVDSVQVHEGLIVLLRAKECEPLRIPGTATLWAVVDWNQNGVEELLILEDGKTLFQVIRKENTLVLSEPLLENLAGTPPLGLHPADFILDLDGDGYLDFLIPVGDQVRIWQGGADGVTKGPLLRGLAQLELRTMEMAGGGMLAEYKRSYSLPYPRTQDVTGDDRLDLLLHSQGTVRQYIAQADGFPSLPSTEVVLDEFRPKFQSDELDFGNLAKLLKYVVVDEWADINHDGATDLLILGGGKVRVFLGDEEGINLDLKMPPLKLAGNPFYLTTSHIDEDEHLDLILMSVEDVGVGHLIKAALTGLKIEFRFMVFKGKGDGKFQRRLYKERKVVLESGRIQDEIKKGKDSLQEQRESIVRLADFDGDGVSTDIVLLSPDGMLSAWFNIAKSTGRVAEIANQFLRDAFAESGEMEVDLGTLTSWAMGRTSALVSLTQGLSPDWSYQLPDSWKKPHAMIVRDFSGDAADEIFVLRRPLSQDDGTTLASELNGWILSPNAK